ncbi:hypothetical protein ACHAPV_009413 [Trichoderma viride]
MFKNFANKGKKKNKNADPMATDSAGINSAASGSIPSQTVINPTVLRRSATMEPNKSRGLVVTYTPPEPVVSTTPGPSDNTAIISQVSSTQHDNSHNEAITKATDVDRDESSSDGAKSIESLQYSTFDHDLQSKGTQPSTLPMSHRGMKEWAPRQVAAIPEAEEPKIADQVESASANLEDLHDLDPLAEDETQEQQPAVDDYDIESTSSIDTLLDDLKLHYLRAFAQQLSEDIKQSSNESCLDNVEAGFLDRVLREFAWKLHGESSNPFQWEASVIIHKKTK